jgi:recombination protein RecT
MSNLQLVQSNIEKQQSEFGELARIHNAVNFKQEASFAVQQLKNNDYLLKVAYANPESLQYAVLNVASIGISLNPAVKHAYLVPRNNKVILDISYMGLTHLACESGAIKWVQAQLVYSKDDYSFNGVGKEPSHKFNPFGDRGTLVGCYVVAKTEDGEYLTDQMAIEEVYAIRDRTEAWKAYKAGKTKSCPWSTDEGEMIKKTVIKRAYKMWPKNDKRLSRAIEVLNTDSDEGINFKAEQSKTYSAQDDVKLLDARKEHEREPRNPFYVFMKGKFRGQCISLIDEDELASYAEFINNKYEKEPFKDADWIETRDAINYHISNTAELREQYNIESQEDEWES